MVLFSQLNSNARGDRVSLMIVLRSDPDLRGLALE